MLHDAYAAYTYVTYKTEPFELEALIDEVNNNNNCQEGETS